MVLLLVFAGSATLPQMGGCDGRCRRDGGQGALRWSTWRQMSASIVHCVTWPRYRQPDCTWSRVQSTCGYPAVARTASMEETTTVPGGKPGAKQRPARPASDFLRRDRNPGTRPPTSTHTTPPPPDPTVLP